MDKQTKKDMLATGAGALAGSALGTAAGHAAADAWNEHHAEEAASQTEVQQTEEDVQQPEEEVTVISTEDITTDDILIEPEEDPVQINVMYGGPEMIETDGPILIDIEPDMYGGPDMYDPDPFLDIETPNITDDILLSDVSNDLPDNIDTGNFDVYNDTYLV